MGLFAAISPFIPSAISAVGSLLGGRAADKGQRAANKMNLKIAREQMTFQERMSSTAYQRSAKDLSAAGLNRILALGGPASSPSGALATMQSESAGKAEALKTGTASALQARIAAQQFKLIEAETNNVTTRTLNEIEKAGISRQQKLMLERTNSALSVTDPAVRGIKDLIPDLPGIGRRAGEALYKLQKPYDPRDVKSRPPKRE